VEEVLPDERRYGTRRVDPKRRLRIGLPGSPGRSDTEHVRLRRRHESEQEALAATPAEADAPDVAETDLARRVLAHASSPEEKLERMLAERSHELEEQAARFELAMEDLERREALLRDMRASVERMLRLGTTDLTEREAEIEQLNREVAERRDRLSAEEDELERRRGELGAVELKREAVEQRERALAAREERLEAQAAQVTQLASRAPERTDNAAAEQPVGLLFVPGTAYALVEVESRPLEPGAAVVHEGKSFVVARLGPAPFPGDPRTCAYLELVAPESSESAGSS
jgi:chromosome segregation ATPase